MAIKEVYDNIDGLENLDDATRETLKDLIKSEISTVNSEAAGYRSELTGVKSEFDLMKEAMDKLALDKANNNQSSNIDINDFKRISNELKELTEFKEASIQEKNKLLQENLRVTVQNDLRSQLTGLPDEAINTIVGLHANEFIKTATGVVQTKDGKTVEQRSAELLTSYASLKANPMPDGGGIIGDRVSNQNGPKISELEKLKARSKQLIK